MNLQSLKIKLLIYYSIHYSFAIVFLAIGLLITHPIVYISQNFRYALRVKQKEIICASENVVRLQIVPRTFEGTHLY